MLLTYTLGLIIYMCDTLEYLKHPHKSGRCCTIPAKKTSSGVTDEGQTRYPRLSVEALDI